MTHGVVVGPGEGRRLSYAGEAVRIIAEPVAGHDGFAVTEMLVPARFAGPVPHVHHTFDEGIYVLDGGLLLAYGDGDPVEAGPGAFCLAPRGVRHTFRNPSDVPARILCLWSPGEVGLAFIEEVGAAIPPGGSPDPAVVADIYRRHGSELRP